MFKIWSFTYFLEVFSQHFRFYSLGFLFLCFHKIFRKIFKTENITFKTIQAIFRIILSDFVTPILRFYIFPKMF